MSVQAKTNPTYKTLEDWVQQEAISFSPDSEESANAAVDQVVASLDDSVQLIGIGEPTHGIEDYLLVRNRLFQRLVEAHDYTAITVESSFPKSRLVNDYILGRAGDSFDAIQEAGFSHFFGKMQANRDLIEWMRQYNADPAHQTKLHFYGFDSPTEMYGTDSPREVLTFVLDYLESVGMPTVQAYRQRIDALLGENAAWENPETLMDSTKSIGLSEAANALRIETEQLISELQIRRPEWIANSSRDRFTEAMQYASIARQLLNYHAALAGQSPDRFVRLLGLRDALMGDLLEYIVSRERERGKVLAFAQNSHLMRGKAEWTIGSDENSWWSAGAHISERFGKAYAMIGMVAATSVASSLGRPETGTLEAALTASLGPARLIPTHQGQHLPAALIAALPTRTANPQYFPLTSHSFTDFDWLCVLDDTPHTPRNVLWP